ncbi:MAG: DUF3052 domain-containing protein [Myxococcota bacterium]
MSFGGPFLIAPLTSLLGIRAGMNVAVHHPPDGFLEALLPLPEGAALVADARTGLDVQVAFCLRKLELLENLTRMTRGMAVMGSIWVCFPTNSDSPHAPSEDFVRLAGLELGLVDTKKVMLDPAWTALKLQWKPRGPRLEKPSVQA